MRILFLNSVSGGGGGVSATLTLVRGLARAGHHVTVACHARGELRRRLEERERLRIAPFRSGPDLDPLAAARIAGMIRDSRADIAIADRRKDVKTLILARTFGRSVPVVHRHGAPSSLRDGPTYRFFWRRVAAVIVNSDAMRLRLLRDAPFLDPHAILVIHNGIDTDLFRPLPRERAASRARLGLGADAFVVSYHGVLQPRKRVATLLEAVARLPAGREVRPLIIGDGPQRRELEDHAARLGVRAVFTGARLDLPPLLAAADVSVHLSAAEGFSNSVIEALACGLPVVASREHSHAEQVDEGRTGLLVAPEPDSVASALGRLLADPATVERLGTSARAEAARRFSTQDMVAAYAAALERICQRVAR